MYDYRYFARWKCALRREPKWKSHLLGRAILLASIAHKSLEICERCRPTVYPMPDQSPRDRVEMRESPSELPEHFSCFGDVEPAYVFELSAAGDLLRCCLGDKAEH